MRLTLLALIAVISLHSGAVPMGSLCLMATAQVAVQERHTPEGHWCQRTMPRMSKNAHACGCHKASCTDDDPSKLPGHTDAMCLNYCHTDNCRCPRQDCP